MEKNIKTADAETIEKWKKQHGDIFKIEVDGHVCYLKKPDRKTLAYVSTLGNNPMRFNEVLLENCWLGGDEVIKTNDDLFLSVSQKLPELISVKTAEITKL